MSSQPERMKKLQHPDQAKPGRVTPAQIMQLVLNLGNRAVSMANFQAAISSGAALDQIADTIRRLTPSSFPYYYGTSMSVLIDAGGYSSVDRRLDQNTFLLADHRKYPGEEIVPAKIELVHAAGQLQPTNEEHANLAELLALGIANPFAQYSFPIICMPTHAGSAGLARSEGVFVPTLTVAGTERVLTLAELDEDLGTLRLWGGVYTGPWAIAVR